MQNSFSGNFPPKFMISFSHWDLVERKEKMEDWQIDYHKSEQGSELFFFFKHQVLL